METTQLKYTPKDFKSDQEIRWCAGCGDIAVINAVHKALAELNIPIEKFAFISGIGCSSRFPYYMNTYGFHSIHGRATAIASGTKVANTDLSVWVITGDGDSMAIGGNHFIHVIRRNVNMNVLLLNNQIYGLTKGQFSPTSKMGQVTKTSPFGTIENPFNPGRLVIGALGRFFARTVDAYVSESVEIFIEAEAHRGTSIIEILQNCVIYNDKAHASITDKATKDETQIWLKHGQPMLFGKDNEMGLMIDNTFNIRAVKIGENGITLDNILIHDAHQKNAGLHLMLVEMHPDNGLPMAFGVIRSIDDDTYSDMANRQIEEVKSKSKIKTMNDLLFSGSTWVVEEKN